MKLAYSEQGERSAPPLILIHAFPVHRLMWKQQMEGLSARYRVLAPDLPGFGESALLEKSPTISAYVDTLLEFMDQMNIPKAVFGGCSMGGYYIFDLWRRFPDKISAICLCDTRAEADTPELKERRANTIELVRAQGLSPLAETLIPQLLCNETREKHPDRVEEIRKQIYSNPVDGIIHSLIALAARMDSTDTLKTITVPTLVLVGQEDVITPPVVAHSLQANIPNAHLTIIPAAGHLSPFEQPEKVNKEIHCFLGVMK